MTQVKPAFALPKTMPESWQKILAEALTQPYMYGLASFLAGEVTEGKTIYPEQDAIFSAFKHTDFDNVSVVILGQDPYHG